MAWIQRLMAITYWPMQKVRTLSGQRKVRYNAAVVSGRSSTYRLYNTKQTPSRGSDQGMVRPSNPFTESHLTGSAADAADAVRDEQQMPHVQLDPV